MKGAKQSVANQGLVGALRGPVIMMTIGVLFLLEKFNVFQFGQTWPVILIVIGGLALAGSRRGLRAVEPPEAPPLYNAPLYPPSPYGSGPRVDPPPPPPGVRR